MKLFKWNLISDLDLYLERQYSFKVFKNRIKQLEEDNFEQYKKICELEKENEWLKANQEIKIVNLEDGLVEKVED